MKIWAKNQYQAKHAKLIVQIGSGKLCARYSGKKRENNSLKEITRKT